jgi:hypothetical protein
MELNLPVTLIIVLLTGALFAFAYWRAKQPAQPLKVRMVNYHVVQLICIVVILVMGAHLVTLLFGAPLTGGAGQAAPRRF